MTEETDEAIDRRLSERFNALDKMTDATISGNIRAFIVSGAPGLGKSFNIEKKLKRYDPYGDTYTIVRGHAKATGIFPTLYKYRHEGQIVVFDDADAIFNDELSLNVLKTATDTSRDRRISWLSKTKFKDEDTGEVLPKSFDYFGSIIFITNIDFNQSITYGSKLAPHLEALMSRSYYVDLTLRTRRECLIRIRQVIRDGLLSDLSGPEQIDVITYLETNYMTLRELSLRTMIKLATLRKSCPDWKKMAEISL